MIISRKKFEKMLNEERNRVYREEEYERNSYEIRKEINELKDRVYRLEYSLINSNRKNSVKEEITCES